MQSVCCAFPIGEHSKYFVLVDVVVVSVEKMVGSLNCRDEFNLNYLYVVVI